VDESGVKPRRLRTLLRASAALVAGVIAASQEARVLFVAVKLDEDRGRFLVDDADASAAASFASKASAVAPSADSGPARSR
jgi:hypothetical protein